MNKFLLIITVVLLVRCSIDRTISLLSDDEKAQLNEFQQLEGQSTAYLAGEHELGEKLMLCLTFVDKAEYKLLTNQSVVFYQAACEGEHQPTDPEDESTACLKANATTDENGRIYVSTILPGDYRSSKDNRHIHTTVIGAKPEAYDIYFKQYTSAMGRSFAGKSDQHFVTDLRITEDGVLVGFLTIEVKNPTGSME